MTICYEEEQASHNIDRFHMKSACIDADDSILLVCRGRVPDMREQVALLILRFHVLKSNKDGNYKLKRDPVILRGFPTIFPRHLDITVRRFDYLLMVQDTEANDEFVVQRLELDVKKKRRDGYNQQHKELRVNELVTPAMCFRQTEAE